MTKEVGFGSEEPVDDVAAHWVARIDNGLTDEEQLHFEEWLDADARHRAAYERLSKAWSDLGIVMERDTSETERDPGLWQRPSVLVRWGTVSAVAACLALVFAFAFRSVNTGTEQPLETFHQASAFEQYELPDGSVIDLNAGARLRMAYTERERTIFMTEGEAHFTVAHDSSRPFVVRTGAASVRAVGTAFNVLLLPDTLEVLVTDGVVRMQREEDADVSEAGPDLAMTRHELSKGFAAAISLAQSMAQASIEKVSELEIEERLAWRPIVFDFDATPLEEVVARFNARNTLQIVIGSDERRHFPITATFRSDNPEGFANLLAMTKGFHVERSDGQRLILR